MEFIIGTLIVTAVICFFVIIIGKKQKIKEDKTDANQPTTGLDLNYMMRDTILKIAMDECNISQEVAEKEVGHSIDKLLNSKKNTNKDNTFRDHYWKPFNNIITYLERLKSSDDTWYWLSNNEMYSDFQESYKELSILYKSEKELYQENISDLINMYEIDSNSAVGIFFLLPIEEFNFINKYINEQFRKGECYWTKVFKNITPHEKKKVADYFPIIERNFPNLSNNISNFRVINNI